jgi:NAD(P)-dependent dehydrogenase (short-subunit alcohol dehydrogenase family)
VSSIFGLAGMPTQGAYNAAKFAVRGFTECLRQELDMTSCGVSATSVHPGGIKTSIARSARMSSNISDLGMDAQSSHEKFEKAFITSPEEESAPRPGWPGCARLRLDGSSAAVSVSRRIEAVREARHALAAREGVSRAVVASATLLGVRPSTA